MKNWLLGWIPWTAVAVLAVLLVLTSSQLQKLTLGYNEQAAMAVKFREQALGQADRLAMVTSNLDTIVQTAQAQAEELRVRSEKQRADLETLKQTNSKLLDERDVQLKAIAEFKHQLAEQKVSVGDLQKQLDERAGRLDVFLDPTLKVASLKSPDENGRTSGMFYWQAGKGTGFVVAGNLPVILKGQDQCLQAWLSCGDQAPIPAGIGWTDAGGRTFIEVRTSKQPACAEKVMLTIEPAGGEPMMTGRVVLTGP